MTGGTMPTGIRMKLTYRKTLIISDEICRPTVLLSVAVARSLFLFSMADAEDANRIFLKRK